jgi:predicted aspartyl protease
MGTFHTTCEVFNHVDREKSAAIDDMLVDTGREYTWIDGEVLRPIGVQRGKKNDLAFLMANGQTVTRSVGFAILRVGEYFTIDEVVFGEPDDLSLLGARTLEGMNVTVNARDKKLVAAGPVPAA